MEQLQPHVSRRIIGKVNIFDLFGKIENKWTEGIKSYMESYIKEFDFKHVILNIQEVNEIDTDKTLEILNVLKLPKKSILYYDTPEIMENFTKGYTDKKMHMCNSQEQIIDILGKELVERDKVIHFNDRRNNVRIKTAISAKIDFVDKSFNTINSQALITNLSESGLFAEYLDFQSSLEVENLDYFKNLTLHIRMFDSKNNNKTIIEKKGQILRIEFSGNQTGIAVKFIS